MKRVLVASAISCVACSLVCMCIGLKLMDPTYIVAGYSFNIIAGLIGVVLAARGE